MFRRARRYAKIGVGAVAFTCISFAIYQATTAVPPLKGSQNTSFRKIPNRDQQLEKLQEGKPFDVLIIGGGATGTGVAFDAATRGLNVALVEREDFASGTSSRSTNLIHGGVRYLENAVKDLDFEQYQLVKEALHERKTLLKIAPHLTYELPIMLPVYKWWQIPYFWVGAKAYDLLAGSQGIEGSYFLTRRKALDQFPMLKAEKLKGAVVYYDGAHNDSRMNISVALTAASEGAVVANYVEVLQLLKKTAEDGSEKIYGVSVRDNLTGKIWNIYAKGVVNATGPFTDCIRKMGSEEVEKICVPSSGTHVILPDYYSPKTMGLIDPNTSDGRVIFFLPWQGSTIAGTTDTGLEEPVQHPKPREEEVSYILKEVANYLNPDVKVRRGDVLATWSGIRPLVRDPNIPNTKRLSRNHVVEVSKEGLITIAGGKWTTFRRMAQDTVDKAIETYGLKPVSGSRTTVTPLVGAEHFSRTTFIGLIQNFGISTEIAHHLAKSYGDRAALVLSHDSPTGKTWPVFGVPLHPLYPFLESEVLYAVHSEYACTAVDVLARRMRLASLNATAAFESLPRTIELMSKELNWSEEREKKEYESAVEYLYTCGLEELSTRAKFNAMELVRFRDAFDQFDPDHDGFIQFSDLHAALKQAGFQDISDDLLQSAKLENKDLVRYNQFLEILANVQNKEKPEEFGTAPEFDQRELEVGRTPIDRSNGSP
eukprot:TRINITY_DN784_c0_g1_i1.p1 TRINITY_DN784_c0_g1~~TRINITY_DN784_c0_g1_i1.p1  ORF type:complete len:710 (-),score=114.24 TRINITY_DN784_c0_g1_i1:652-2781(-)